MSVVRRLIWVTGRVGLVLGLLTIAGVGLARDGHRASGVTTTEILPSLSGTSATYVASQILVKGGLPSDNPCIPGSIIPTGRCIYVWAKNVSNTTGVSAFQIHATYPSQGLAITSLAAQNGANNWLKSTGRSVSCPPVANNPGEAAVGCSSFLPPPPLGPNCPSHCSGSLAALAVVSQNTIGTFTLNLSPLDKNNQIATYLLDTPFPDANGNIPFARIPATVSSTNFVVAPCADYNGDNAVRVADILYVVSKYFTNDHPADLTGDGTVRVNDILVAVGEYFVDCVADW